MLLAALAWAGVSGAQVSPAAPTAVAVGDWKLTPVFDARTRVEGRYDLDEVDRAMLFERVRLGVDGQYDAVESRVVLQDARALALDTGSFLAGPSSTASTGVYEAWVQAIARGGAPSFVRVGRQSVTWGEGRLLGISDASPAGRSLYALRARWSSGDGAVELLVAALEEPPSSGAFAPDFYGELVGIRGEWSFDPLVAFEVYGLGRLAQINPTDAATSVDSSVKGETYTGSLRLHGDGRSWAWSTEGAYQLGYASAYAASRAAWAAAGHVEHAFELAIWRPTVRLGLSYASGDTGSAKYRAFDPILPDVQAWHGAMDLFTWSNEEEVNASVSVAPWIDSVVAVEYRYARLAVQGGLWRSDYQVTLGAAPGDTDAALGHEIDAKLAWAPWAPLNLEAGYSVFIVGEAARSILTASRPGSVPDVSHMGYAEARVAF